MEEEKLIRFLNKESSQRENREVLDWLKHPGSDKALAEMFHKTWIENSPPESGEEARYEKMLKRIHDATTFKKNDLNIDEKWIKWGRIAASYLLLLFSSYFLFQIWSGDGHPEEQERKAIYEKTTSAGEKLKIQLPDGSTVILNSLSTIIFDADFSKTHRLIDLQGEAYFEIKPDENLPFVVQAQEVRTTALGTAYNARSKDGKVTISLIEGKVSVSHLQSELTLNPGQMAVYDPLGENGLMPGTFDPASVTAWKEGKISFKNKALENIMEDLEDWYGVDFIIKGDVDLKRRVTGLINNNSLKEIMTGLSFSLALEYSIHGNQVTIQPLRPMK